MRLDTPPTDPTQAPTTLCIDIGGSHLKAGLVGARGTLIGEAIRVVTPTPATPAAVLAVLAKALPPLGAAARIAVGFPGVVRDGVVLTAPNMGTPAWHGYPLADKLSALSGGAPVRLANDATVQGLGVIAGQGLECVITLGTGMGFALFDEGRPTPHLELSQLIAHGHKTFDAYIGNEARLGIGDKRWNKRIEKVVETLRTLANFDVLLIGGGNGKYLAFDLPADVRVVSNAAGITGGVGLWRDSAVIPA